LINEKYPPDYVHIESFDDNVHIETFYEPPSPPPVSEKVINVMKNSFEKKVVSKMIDVTFVKSNCSECPGIVFKFDLDNRKYYLTCLDTGDIIGGYEGVLLNALGYYREEK